MNKASIPLGSVPLGMMLLLMAEIAFIIHSNLSRIEDVEESKRKREQEVQVVERKPSARLRAPRSAESQSIFSSSVTMHPACVKFLQH